MPLPGYDLTLLLTHRHLERYSREGLVDFICQARGGRVGRQREEGHMPCSAPTTQLPVVLWACLLSTNSNPVPWPPSPTVQFVEDVHSEVSAMKLGLRSRARAVVQRYWQELEAVGAGADRPDGTSC